MDLRDAKERIEKLEETADDYKQFKGWILGIGTAIGAIFGAFLDWMGHGFKK
jgi:hypothetical protein